MRRQQIALAGAMLVASGCGEASNQVSIAKIAAQTSSPTGYHVAAPSARSGAAMAYDPAAKRLVLYGGEVGGPYCPNGPSRAARAEWTATWLYKAGRWSQSEVAIDMASGLPPAAPAMVYDPAIHTSVLVGITDGLKNRTWLLRAGRWRRLAATTPDSLSLRTL